MNFLRTRALLLATLAGATLFAIGCGDSVSTQLRVLHASPVRPMSTSSTTARHC